MTIIGKGTAQGKTLPRLGTLPTDMAKSVILLAQVSYLTLPSQYISFLGS